MNEALEQIAFADRIILNKTDLSTPSALTALEARLRSINSMASITRAKRGVVDIDYVLGVGGFDLERLVDSGAFSLEAEEEEGHGHSHAHAHSHGGGEAHEGECGECGESSADGHSHSHGHEEHAAHEGECGECGESTADGHSHSHSHGQAHGEAPKLHNDAVTSVSLRLGGELDLDAVNDWLGDLLAQRWQDMYRMKGVLAIQGYDERYVIQGVHALFEGACDRPWGAKDARGSKLVFIGKKLEEKELRLGFEACLASSEK